VLIRNLVRPFPEDPLAKKTRPRAVGDGPLEPERCFCSTKTVAPIGARKNLWKKDTKERIGEATAGLDSHELSGSR